MSKIGSIGFAPNGHVQFQWGTDSIDVCVTIELEELEYIIHNAKKIKNQYQTKRKSKKNEG